MESQGAMFLFSSKQIKHSINSWSYNHWYKDTHRDFIFFLQGGDHVIYDTLSQGQDRDVLGKN